jgi:phage-related protein
MPSVNVLFYRSEDGTVPVLEWLRHLRQRERRAYAKCIVRIQRLAEEGHELRRPEADYLRDGIYELRTRFRSVNYRILYFFSGREAAVLSHALTKEAEIPAPDIERAIRRKEKFEQNPDAHTHEEADV